MPWGRLRGLASSVLLATLTSCGHETDNDEGRAPAELLAQACESFCDRALSCPLGRYAEEWGFEDLPSCTSDCLLFHANPQSTEPPEFCMGVRAELWSCAGEIEDCEVFQSFEDDSFAETNPVPNPCDAELDALLHKCN